MWSTHLTASNLIAKPLAAWIANARPHQPRSCQRRLAPRSQTTVRGRPLGQPAIPPTSARSHNRPEVSDRRGADRPGKNHRGAQRHRSAALRARPSPCGGSHGRTSSLPARKVLLSAASGGCTRQRISPSCSKPPRSCARSGRTLCVLAGTGPLEEELRQAGGCSWD